MIQILEGNDFLIEEYIKEYEAKFLKNTKPFQRKFSFLRNPDSISIILNRSPLGTKERIIVWSWEVFKKFTEFNPYIIPKETTIFVTGKKIDKRLKIYKTLVDSFNAKLEDKKFKDLYPNQVEAWILARKTKIKLNIDIDAVKLLAVLYGTNLQELANQLDYFKSLNKPITKEIVTNTSAAVNVFSVFELQDYLILKNTPKVIYVYRQLIKSGSQGFEILRYLTSYFDKLITVKVDDKILIENLKLHPYVLKKMQETRTTLAQCKYALSQIRLTEKKIFHGLPVNYVVERLLFNLCKN